MLRIILCSINEYTITNSTADTVKNNKMQYEEFFKIILQTKENEFVTFDVGKSVHHHTIQIN